MQRPIKTIAKIAGVTGLLALASFLTTSRQWDGGFPAGEFRINVRSTDEQPIPGAVLRIYRGGTGDMAYDYPLDNHSASQALIGDGSGRITALRKHGGLQFGGHGWRLFWVIPMGARAPRYDCEITAAGFKSLKFDLHQMFKSPHHGYENFPKTKRMMGGEEVELAVRENTFTLER